MLIAQPATKLRSLSMQRSRDEWVALARLLSQIREGDLRFADRSTLGARLGCRASLPSPLHTLFVQCLYRNTYAGGPSEKFEPLMPDWTAYSRELGSRPTREDYDVASSFEAAKADYQERYTDA